MDPRGPRHRQLLFCAPGRVLGVLLPGALPCGAARSGAESGPRAGRRAPAGRARAEGDSGGIRRKGSARRKGWTQERPPSVRSDSGEQGVGVGRRGCGMKKALGFGRAERKCLGVKRLTDVL